MSFEDKVVIVTGGSSGIGAATVIEFAKNLAKVVIVGRNEGKLKKVAEECRKLNADYLVIKADVTDEDQAKNIINQTIEKFGQLDVLVNNAGMIREGSILNGGLLDDYDKTMNTNLRAVVALTCFAAPHLIKTRGNIINISSIAGTSLLKTPIYMDYCTSKAGLDMFTRASALELGAHGVRVNSVNPGPVKTSFILNGGIKENIEDWDKYTVLGRVTETAEVADLIIFLASDKAKGITGSKYFCDNGYLCLQ